MKLGTPIVPGFCIRQPDGTYVTHLEAPIAAPARGGRAVRRGGAYAEAREHHREVHRAIPGPVVHAPADLGHRGRTVLKIGIVTPTYHPYPGGVTEHVYHLCVELGTARSRRARCDDGLRAGRGPERGAGDQDRTFGRGPRERLHLPGGRRRADEGQGAEDAPGGAFRRPAPARAAHAVAVSGRAGGGATCP